jgi:predicted metal-dependent peptidase
MSGDARQRLLKARTTLVLQHPFFATLALRLRLQEDEGCGNAWTDGEVLGYNSAYILTLKDDELLGLMAHLVMHPACGHHRRRGGRDVLLWNIACDYAINWLLLDAGFTLPPDFLLIEGFREMSAEAVYSRLFETSDGIRERGGDDEGPGKGREKEEKTPAAGEVRDAPMQSQGADLGAEGVDWEQAFINAANTAREIGRLPPGVEQLVNRRLYPRLDWRQILSRFIERSARFDYSWMTPNRRYLHQGYYFPSLINSELHQIVVAVDTSGSISRTEMDQFAAELSAIMDQYPATLHLFYCDMQVRRHEEVERSELPLRLEPVGGGGTDFRPVFRRIEQEGLQPACLIYLTDLRCHLFPAVEPDYPVLWAQIGDEDHQTPPFGDLLRVAGLARGVHEGDGVYK